MPPLCLSQANESNHLPVEGTRHLRFLNFSDFPEDLLTVNLPVSQEEMTTKELSVSHMNTSATCKVGNCVLALFIVGFFIFNACIETGDFFNIHGSYIGIHTKNIQLNDAKCIVDLHLDSNSYFHAFTCVTMALVREPCWSEHTMKTHIQVHPLHGKKKLNIPPFIETLFQPHIIYNISSKTVHCTDPKYYFWRAPYFVGTQESVAKKEQFFYAWRKFVFDKLQRNRTYRNVSFQGDVLIINRGYRNINNSREISNFLASRNKTSLEIRFEDMPYWKQIALMKNTFLQ